MSTEKPELTLRLYVRDVTWVYQVTGTGKKFLEKVGGKVWDIYSYIPEFYAHACSAQKLHECYAMGTITSASFGKAPGEPERDGDEDADAAWERWWMQLEEEICDANRGDEMVIYVDPSDTARSSIDDSTNHDGSRAWDWDDLEEYLAQDPQDPAAIRKAEHELHDRVREHYAGNDLSSVVSRYLREKGKDDIVGDVETIIKGGKYTP